MGTIYITGHRNPDLDSICSAYAYAELKNKIDPENTYIAVRCGHLSDDVKKIVIALNIKVPPFKGDILPKVKDIMLTKTDHRVDCNDPITVFAQSYNDANPSATPVFDGDKFYGLLSVDDILTWVMQEFSKYGNLSHTPIIKDIMRDQEPPLSVNDMLDEARKRLDSTPKRGIAVFGENGYAGFVTRRCFMKNPRHNVILVDHNEPRQSINGIDKANVVEIIDHHRIDSVKTDVPIFIDAEPLGSTCTIVYRLFKRYGISPDTETAKVLLTGLVSDTLILRSPTTTTADEDAAKELADIIGVDLNEFGINMFSNIDSLKDRNASEAIASDFKTYKEHGIGVGIGQCEVTTLHDLSDYKDNYLETLEDIRQKSGLDWAMLLVTDIIRERSVLLVTKHKANMYLNAAPMEDNIYDMPGILSRKKQLLPMVLSAIELGL